MENKYNKLIDFPASEKLIFFHIYDFLQHVYVHIKSIWKKASGPVSICAKKKKYEMSIINLEKQ